MNSPRWLFLYPGVCLIGLGVAGYALALPGARIGGIRFDAHTLLLSSLAVLAGHQAVTFALLVKTFAIREGLLPPNRRMDAFHRAVTLERALALSLTVLGAGAILLVAAVNVGDRIDRIERRIRGRHPRRRAPSVHLVVDLAVARVGLFEEPD